VSARGVDYPNVTHVIQIGMPSSSESYAHRLGRTGRAGSAGEGILVLTPLEAGFVDLLKGEGIALPLHDKMQSMVDSEDEDSPNKHVRQELHPVMESIRSGKNKALVQAAEDTYRSVLGYYNTQRRLVGYPGPNNLVEFSNFMGVELGLTRFPGIGRKTAGTLGISRVPGVVIDEPSQRGRGYAPSHGYNNNYDRRGPGGGGGGNNNRGYRPIDLKFYLVHIALVLFLAPVCVAYSYTHTHTKLATLLSSLFLLLLFGGQKGDSSHATTPPGFVRSTEQQCTQQGRKTRRRVVGVCVFVFHVL
jgi:hypothetical protein